MYQKIVYQLHFNSKEGKELTNLSPFSSKYLIFAFRKKVRADVSSVCLYIFGKISDIKHSYSNRFKIN